MSILIISKSNRIYFSNPLGLGELSLARRRLVRIVMLLIIVRAAINLTNLNILQSGD